MRSISDKSLDPTLNIRVGGEFTNCTLNPSHVPVTTKKIVISGWLKCVSVIHYANEASEKPGN